MYPSPPPPPAPHEQVVSVAIGFAVKRVPAAVESSEVLGQWAGAALLAYFGLRTLKDAWDKGGGGEAGAGGKGEELADAEEQGAGQGRVRGWGAGRGGRVWRCVWGGKRQRGYVG